MQLGISTAAFYGRWETEEAALRIDAQMPLAEKERRADAVISTLGSIFQTRSQIDAHLAFARQRRQA